MKLKIIGLYENNYNIRLNKLIIVALIGGNLLITSVSLLIL